MTYKQTEFASACRSGELDKVKVLFDVSQKDEGLLQACAGNQLTIVQYLLGDKELNNNPNNIADIHVHSDLPVQLACQNGNIPLVKYLLTSPDISEHANLYATTNSAVYKACSKGFIELVEYLLEYDQQKNISLFDIIPVAAKAGHLDFVKHFTNKLQDTTFYPEETQNNYVYQEISQRILVAACEGGHLDLVQYSLTDFSLKQNVKINYNHNLALRTACENNHDDVALHLLKARPENKYLEKEEDYALQLICKNNMRESMEYLILDKNIKISANTDIFIYSQVLANNQHPGCTHARKLIDIRTLNQELESKLPIKDSQSKKLKL